MGETIISKFGHGGVRANSGGARANTGGARAGAGRPFKATDAPMPVSNVPRWYVYQTHPQAERLAAEDLTRSGYHGYAPLIAVRKRDVVLRSLFHKVRVPRFPGYGFVSLAPSDPWQPILETPGVARLLRGLDGRPARVPVGEIEEHQREDNRLCDLANLVMAEQAREILPELALDAQVLVVFGALAGHVGRVIECDGLSTLVRLVVFNRPMPVRLDRASVELV